MSVQFLVYPVARGTGVAITAVLAGPLLGEVVSVVGGFGVASIISGIVIMSLAKMDVFCCECVNLDLLGREKIALTRLEKVKKKERGKRPWWGDESGGHELFRLHIFCIYH